jgi:hypothetical protein
MSTSSWRSFPLRLTKSTSCVLHPLPISFFINASFLRRCSYISELVILKDRGSNCGTARPKTNKQKNKQTNSVALSPRANYTDWAITTNPRNLGTARHCTTKLPFVFLTISSYTVQLLTVTIMPQLMETLYYRSRVRVPMRTLNFISSDPILPAALGAGVYSASNRNEYQIHK